MRRLYEMAAEAGPRLVIGGYVVFMAGMTVLCVLALAGVIHAESKPANAPLIQPSDVDWASHR